MKVELRRLEDDLDDYKLLFKWCQEKDIYTYFEQRKLTLKEIIKKYQPRTKSNSKIPVYLIIYEDKPVGIVQYQKINDEEFLHELNSQIAYDIDIFIGELSYHNKGIGSLAIKEIREFLIKNCQADTLIMCPLKENIKAIKCYQKCGFKIINEYKSTDTINNMQTYYLMVKKKEE